MNIPGYKASWVDFKNRLILNTFLVSILHDLQWPEGLGRWTAAALSETKFAPAALRSGSCLK